MDIQWLFHTLYNPHAAGTIERCNSLLKQGLQVLRHPLMMHDWASHLWEVLRTLNEKPRRGGPSPVEALLHGTAAPVQLQVNTSEVLLKPAYVRSGNILLPAPTCLKAGEQQQWTWPWCLWVNTIMDWVHTYAGMANVFDCCVCTEFPVSTAVGLLWCIHPATAEDWTWLRGWNPWYEAWDATWQYVLSCMRAQRNHTKQWLSHAIWDGWGWLMSESVELTQLIPVCLERQTSDRDVGWVPAALCQNITRVPEGQVWWNGQKQQGLAPTTFVPKGEFVGLWPVWMALPPCQVDRELYMGEAVPPS
ncbi:PREDICTED: uncharacterized protein LOC109395549 [Hipposideros armiger]|uniref:Uncharacterized protein LOC109395549 n=1 Tax=Hipposideros armiger TaxID=186990 RepID=A0A8B7TBT2_HIPAR|nr:PREDICTED: uncharacterized protein LOC109395549 [Hipposideros armiger]